MASEIFGRQRECRFHTAGCGNKIVVSVTGPPAANELGGPVIPGMSLGGLERKFPWNCFNNNNFFFSFAIQVIFIHYKSRIATAIRGL